MMNQHVKARLFGLPTLIAVSFCAAPRVCSAAAVDERSALEGRVSSESGGAIVVKRFGLIDEKQGQEEGRDYIVCTYKADLLFSRGGVWQAGDMLGARSLMAGRYPPAASFNVSVPPDFARMGGGNMAKLNAERRWHDAHPGTEVAAGTRVSIVGQMVFSMQAGKWGLAKLTFDINNDPGLWILPAEDTPERRAPADASAVAAATPELSDNFVMGLLGGYFANNPHPKVKIHGQMIAVSVITTQAVVSHDALINTSRGKVWPYKIRLKGMGINPSTFDEVQFDDVVLAHVVRDPSGAWVLDIVND